LFGVEQNGAHHTVEDFSIRGKEPKDEVQIYTWRDATLRELTDLVMIVLSAPPRLHPAVVASACHFGTDVLTSLHCVAYCCLSWCVEYIEMMDWK